MLPVKVLYAALDPDGRPLCIGTSNYPIQADYATFYRLHRKFGAIPDVIILEEFDYQEDYRPLRDLWKRRFKHLSWWDMTKNNPWNVANQERLRAEFVGDRVVIKGSSLIRKRQPIFTPLSPD